MYKAFDRSGDRNDGVVTKASGTQRSEHTPHRRLRKRTSHREAGASILKRYQRNEDEHDERDSVIVFQSRFKGGELGRQVN